MGGQVHTESSRSRQESRLLEKWRLPSSPWGQRPSQTTQPQKSTPSPVPFLIKSYIPFHPMKRVCANPMLKDPFGQFTRQVLHLKEYLTDSLSLSLGPQGRSRKPLRINFLLFLLLRPALQLLHSPPHSPSEGQNTLAKKSLEKKRGKGGRK